MNHRKAKKFAYKQDCYSPILLTFLIFIVIKDLYITIGYPKSYDFMWGLYVHPLTNQAWAYDPPLSSLTASNKQKSYDHSI